MYGLIWRVLPGPLVVRLFLALALLVGAVALLWFVVFPWIDPYLPFNDVTVGSQDGGAPAQGGASESGDTEGPGYETGEEEGIVGVDVPVESDGE